MKPLLPLVLAAALASFGPVSLAADTPAPKAANKTAKAPATPKTSAAQTGDVDAQITAMREMHEKMIAAKTPEERNALMAEHMKTMQNGMSMMNGMWMPGGMPMMNGMMGGSPSGSPPHMRRMSPQMMQKQMETMQKQMEVMQAMMQLMIDRIGPPTPAK